MTHCEWLEEHGFINVSHQYIELINKMVQILNNLDQSIIDKYMKMVIS